MFDGSFALLKRVFRYLPFSAGESTDTRLDLQLGGGVATLAALIPNKTLVPSQAVLAFNQLVRTSADIAPTVEAITAPAVAAIEPVSRGTAYRPLAAQIAYQARMNTPVGRKPRTSTEATARNRPVVIATPKKSSKTQPIRTKTKIVSQSASIHALPTSPARHDHGLRLVA